MYSHKPKIQGFYVPMPANPEPVHPPKNKLFKPKRAGGENAPTHVVFILDSSSSMLSSVDTTVSGYNEYLDTQRKEAIDSGIDTIVSLYTFDGRRINNLIDRKNILEVEPISTAEYYPSGMTNLYDAIGNVMFNLNHEFKKVAKKDRESVIVTILTDGHENASKEFTSKDIKEMVKKSENKGWAFMFLGANIDAFAVGSTLGMGQHNTVQYNMTNIKDAVATASVATNRIKESTRSGLNVATAYAGAISDEDRKKLV